jgi:hypothetical protein
VPWGLLRIARTKSRELFLLVVTLSLGIALTAAGLFGVSLALGAFLAPVLYGDAGNSEILDHAGLDRARPLVVTIPDDPAAGLAVAAARQAAPHLPIVARASTRSARKITPTAAWPLTSVSAPSFGRRAKKLSTPLDTQLWPGCIRGVHQPT